MGFDRSEGRESPLSFETYGAKVCQTMSKNTRNMNFQPTRGDGPGVWRFVVDKRSAAMGWDPGVDLLERSSLLRITRDSSSKRTPKEHRTGCSGGLITLHGTPPEHLLA